MCCKHGEISYGNLFGQCWYLCLWLNWLFGSFIVTWTIELNSTAGDGEYTCRMSTGHRVKLWTIFYPCNDLYCCTLISVVSLFHLHFYKHDSCKYILIFSFCERMHFAKLLTYISRQSRWLNDVLSLPLSSLLYFI